MKKRTIDPFAFMEVYMALGRLYGIAERVENLDDRASILDLLTLVEHVLDELLFPGREEDGDKKD